VKIQIKTNNRNFRLLFPLQILRFLPYFMINVCLKIRSVGSGGVYIKKIDSRMVRKSLKLLRVYKGFNILEVKSSEGSVVSVVI
jgi:hypothetical protein